MKEGTSDVLAMIGGMETLVKNFPMGLLTAAKTKEYTSVIDFIVDCLGGIGITDQEILAYILKNIIGVKMNVKFDAGKINKWIQNINFEDLSDNSFIQGLESATKAMIATILTEILSCHIHPLIPKKGFSEGFKCPIPIIDTQNLLNICPTTPVGRKFYDGITDETKPSSLINATDMNAFIWYCMYRSNTGEKWTNVKTIEEGEEPKDICTIINEDYNALRFKISDNYEGKSLWSFNKDYLNNIKIFSTKILITNLIDELILGLPNVNISYGIDDIVTDATINKIIKEVIENDDLEINNCYFGFSNEEWDNLIKESELRKYNAVSLNSETAGAIEIDKQSVLDSLNSASSAATLYEQNSIITSTIYNIAATPAQDASVESSDKFSVTVNPGWLSNVILKIVRPIVRSILTPKLMSLLYINYDIGGVINLATMDYNNIGSIIMSSLKTKILAFIKSLVKYVKDAIVDMLEDFFEETIKPLIAKYSLKKIQEKMEDYAEVLAAAYQFLAIFLNKKKTKTAIDDVNYADIIPEKITPAQSIC